MSLDELVTFGEYVGIAFAVASFATLANVGAHSILAVRKASSAAKRARRFIKDGHINCFKAAELENYLSAPYAVRVPRDHSLHVALATYAARTDAGSDRALQAFYDQPAIRAYLAQPSTLRRVLQEAFMS